MIERTLGVGERAGLLRLALKNLPARKPKTTIK
jgi:hypothetical protein